MSVISYVMLLTLVSLGVGLASSTATLEPSSSAMRVGSSAVRVGSSGAAPSCSGNACDDIVFYWENGCHMTRNAGTRRVKVKRGPYSFTLQRGEVTALRGFSGECIQAYIGENTANYE